MKIALYIALYALASSTLAQDYKSFISHWEGNENAVYTCSAGHQTIGIGHKLKPTEDFEWLESEAVTMLFYQDLEVALSNSRKYVRQFDDRPEIVRLVICDFFFNLGETRGKKFVKMLDACNQKDYIRMAEELKDSKYYRQTGRRSKHHVKVLGEL